MLELIVIFIWLIAIIYFLGFALDIFSIIIMLGLFFFMVRLLTPVISPGPQIERFEHHQQYNIQPFETFYSQPFGIDTAHLVPKPIYNDEPSPGYLWWKYQSDYLNHLYKGCDQYRCKSDQFNGYKARPEFNLIGNKYKNPATNFSSINHLEFNRDPLFYEDPMEYCLNNPNYRFCINNWIDDNHQLKQ